MWKDFFYYSKRERRGIFVLFFLIAIAVVANLLLEDNAPVLTKSGKTLSKDTSYYYKKKYYDKTKDWKKQIVHLRAFDPNSADSLTLLSLGLKPWMAKNIIRYRSKGGVFRKPEDFKKIYGLDEKQYMQLLPYIHIGDLAKVVTKHDTVKVYVQRKDSFIKAVKYTQVVKVDLNTSDTTELKKIPGIGSGIAKRIVAYRSALGGYYHVKQLAEIDLDVKKLEPWFHVNHSDIQPIPVNQWGIQRLKSHPYINFYQARVFVEYRKKVGKIKSLETFSLLDEFTSADMERLKYYLSFD